MEIIFMKSKYLLLALVILFGLSGCGVHNEVAQTEQIKADVYNINTNQSQNANESNSNRPVNAKVSSAKAGPYESEKGIIITIPAEWENKVEISEDPDFIILTYTGIPGRRFEIFTIACLTKQKYRELPKNEPLPDLLGQNQKYVFGLVTPLAIDLTSEEQQKYVNEIHSFLLPIKDYKDKIKVKSN